MRLIQKQMKKKCRKWTEQKLMLSFQLAQREENYGTLDSDVPHQSSEVHM